MSETVKNLNLYVPPAKALQKSFDAKASPEMQQLAWRNLKKSINGLINKVNSGNLSLIVRELFKENLIRGRGVLCSILIRAQISGPTFTPVYAALAAIINSKLPFIGELLLARLLQNFKKNFYRNDKNGSIMALRFIAHLINQDVVHELIAFEISTLLMENISDSNLEIAVAFLKECGAKICSNCPREAFYIFEILRATLNEGHLDQRVRFTIESIMAIRKENFKDFPAIAPDLDILEEADKITHRMDLVQIPDTMENLNVYSYDPEYMENEREYEQLKKDILGADNEDDDEDDDGDYESSDEDEDEENEEAAADKETLDLTGNDMIALKRKIYLTIQSSLDADEATHKLLKLELKGKARAEKCWLILDCCAQQRTYLKYYGLTAEKFCSLMSEYIGIYSEIFTECYKTIHRFSDTNKIRQVANFFAHLLYTDSIPWTVLSVIRINEQDTSSSSRVFLKYLFQELASHMGNEKLDARFKDPTLSESFAGIFPRDDPRNTRFAINFFTVIGLGGLVQGLQNP